MTNENTPPPQELVNKYTEEFAAEIKQKAQTGEEAVTSLNTDQKVLARITDGIYRQPSSALRELICNSYDADATEVYIDTDAPRFKRITVRDDGNGMTPEILSNMLHHIGGSAKRNYKQLHLGISDQQDITRSPIRHRKLIGKIGIGLFSVAQLTRDFSIVTKTKGSSHYLVADVKLHNYSEEEIREIEKRGATFETGTVTVYSKKASDADAHGTDIILRNIKNSAVDQLRSVEIWQQALGEDQEFVGADAKPAFHIGAMDHNNEDLILEKPNYPWDRKDDPAKKFRSFYEKFIGVETTQKHPSLQKDLDTYFQMLWSLGLSLPLDYISKSPYSCDLSDTPYLFKIENQSRKASRITDLGEHKTVGEYLSLAHQLKTDFKVFIDGVELFRPIKAVEPISTAATLDKPILFYGKYAPDLSKIDKHASGGSLAFEAFIKWAPRIIPKEHAGVSIRINGATGVMFDQEFMKWQLAEHFLKKQLTVEIYIEQGFESALNIDRESFNIAHPHYQIVMRWLHHALKQAVNAVKDEQKNLRASHALGRVAERRDALSTIVRNVKSSRHDDSITPARVEIADEPTDVPKSTNTYVISTSTFDNSLYAKTTSYEKKDKTKQKLSAIVGVLDKFELLESLTDKERDELMNALIKILSYED